MALPGLRKEARAWAKMHKYGCTYTGTDKAPGSLHPCPGPTDTHAQSLTRGLEALISFRSRVFPQGAPNPSGLCMCKNRVEKGKVRRMSGESGMKC